jgi:hypothetical protein
MSHSAEFIARKTTYSILAFVFGVAAFYHLIALFWPNYFPPSPVWRHITFFILNLAASILSVRRWIWLWVPVTFLAIQQLISHGSRLYAWWILYRRADTISIIIIVSMPLIAAFLFYDFRLRKKRSANQ